MGIEPTGSRLEIQGVLLLFSQFMNQPFAMENSKMPKVSKRRKANKLNAQKGGYHLYFTQSAGEDGEQSDDNETDEDYFYGTQPRRVDNSDSMSFMKMKMLQSLKFKQRLILLPTVIVDRPLLNLKFLLRKDSLVFNRYFVQILSMPYFE